MMLQEAADKADKTQHNLFRSSEHFDKVPYYWSLFKLKSCQDLGKYMGVDKVLMEKQKTEELC